MNPTIITFHLLLCFFLFKPCSSPTPTVHNCSNIRKKVYNKCINLSTLDSTLQYSFNTSNSTLSVVFESAPPRLGGWVAWGLNPTNKSMVGGQVIACYKDKYGMAIKTLDIRSYFHLVYGKLKYDVWGLKAEYEAGRMKIFASLKIPPNTTELNHIWQTGPGVTNDGSLSEHSSDDENKMSIGTIRLTADYTESEIWWIKVHGVMSAVCWGFLHPLGVTVARYGPKVLLSYPTWWYYPYICCQVSSSIGGLMGFVIGVVVGSRSENIRFNGHFIVAIVLLILHIIQILILILKPNEDHKYFKFWDNCHYSIGYLVSFFGILNVWIGFKISKPPKTWIEAYGTWMAVLGGIVALEMMKLIGCPLIKKLTKRASQTGYGHVQPRRQSGLHLTPFDKLQKP